MLLTKAQQRRFWAGWQAACKAQGWTKANSWTGLQIDNERHALLEKCGFDSLTKVDPLAGFDRVLAELRSVSQPANLDAQLRQAKMPRTRLLYAIASLDKQISGGARSPSAPDYAPSPYVAAIMKDRFNTVELDRLSLEQLTQLRNTLAARKCARSEPARRDQFKSNYLSPDSEAHLKDRCASATEDDSEPF